jgi:hypothetical protein
MINDIFVEYGAKIFAIDSSYQLTSDKPAITKLKAAIIIERNSVLKFQRELYADLT